MKLLIIFDLDNTLVHYHDLAQYVDELLVNVLQTLYPKQQLPEKQVREKLWGAGDKYPELLRAWGISDIREFWAEFDNQDYERRVQMANNGEIRISKDVLRTLKELSTHDHKLAILSNSNVPIAHYLCEFFEIDHYFEILAGLDADKTPEICKPEPGNLIHIIEELGFGKNLNRVYMVGDSFSDVLAAKRAGVHPILYSPGQRRENIFPEEITEDDYRIIMRMTDLLSILPNFTTNIEEETQ